MQCAQRPRSRMRARPSATSMFEHGQTFAQRPHPLQRSGSGSWRNAHETSAAPVRVAASAAANDPRTSRRSRRPASTSRAMASIPASAAVQRPDFGFVSAPTATDAESG